jgi:hypothetical protein
MVVLIAAYRRSANPCTFRALLRGLCRSRSMKSAAFVGAIALTVAGGAMAKPALSEADYLRASRCRGLAAGFGVIDPGFGAVLKATAGERGATLQERAGAEFIRARREAVHSDGHDRLAAELTGGCKVFLTLGDSNTLH